MSISFSPLIDTLCCMIRERKMSENRQNFREYFHEYFSPYEAKHVLTWTIIRRIDYVKYSLAGLLSKLERSEEIIEMVEIIDEVISFTISQVYLYYEDKLEFDYELEKFVATEADYLIEYFAYLRDYSRFLLI